MSLDVDVITLIKLEGDLYQLQFTDKDMVLHTVVLSDYVASTIKIMLENEGLGF